MTNCWFNPYQLIPLGRFHTYYYKFPAEIDVRFVFCKVYMVQKYITYMGSWISAPYITCLNVK